MTDLQKTILISGWIVCLLLAIAFNATCLVIWIRGSEVPKALSDMALLSLGFVFGSVPKMAEKALEK